MAKKREEKDPRQTKTGVTIDNTTTQEEVDAQILKKANMPDEIVEDTVEDKSIDLNSIADKDGMVGFKIDGILVANGFAIETETGVLSVTAEMGINVNGEECKNPTRIYNMLMNYVDGLRAQDTVAETPEA
jgi:hypothetical protein